MSCEPSPLKSPTTKFGVRCESAALASLKMRFTIVAISSGFGCELWTGRVASGAGAGADLDVCESVLVQPDVKQMATTTATVSNCRLHDCMLENLSVRGAKGGSPRKQVRRAS